MEGVHIKGGGGGELRPQLLELIPNKMEWIVRDRGGGGGGGEAGNGYSAVTAAAAAAAAAVVEKQLELRLGPPGGGGDALPSAASVAAKEAKVVNEPCSMLSLGLFPKPSGNPSAGAKRGFRDTLDDSKGEAYPPQKAGFFGAGGASKEEAASHKAAPDGGGNAEKQQLQHRPGERNKATAAPSVASANAAADAANSRPSQAAARTSQPPVVGWPPIRSFRKNIAAASSSKPSSSSSSPQNGGTKDNQKKPAVENTTTDSNRNKSMLVKINMDGVPIGRKVDLVACSGYDRLSVAVDQLFRGLLAAQRVLLKDHGATSLASPADQDAPAITGLLDGSGEYTLVYEDNEGDRMLVGDVPWEMFVSTVKRLRVLKSSELPSLSLGVGAATRRMKSSAAAEC